MGVFARRATAALAVVPLLAATLAGCGYGSQRVGSAPLAASPVAARGPIPKLSAAKVRVGFFPNITHATPLVGLREGTLAGHLGATRIEPQVFASGPAEIEAINAGSLDMAWIGPSPAVNGYVRSHGKDLRIVAGSASGGVQLVVNPKAVHSVADLAGKHLASPQLGNTQDVALLSFLRRHGYTEDAQTGRGDVKVLRSGNAEIPRLFARGQLDGAWVPEPTASRLVAEGGKVLVDERSLWPHGRFLTTALVVSQKFLAAHPDVVKAVVAGSVDTNAWIAAHPKRARADVDTQLRHITGAGLPTAVLDRAWRELTVTDDPLAATLRTEAAHATASGLLHSTADLRGIYDLGPLNAVRQARGEPAYPDAGLGG